MYSGGPPFIPMSNDGIRLPISTDGHCHRLIGTAADQNTLATSQETNFLTLAGYQLCQGTLHLFGPVQQEQLLQIIWESRTSPMR